MASNDRQQGAKITLHWLNSSRAQRIIWLLEELKLDYELKVYKRGKDMLAPKELKSVHPLGKSPAISIQAAGVQEPIVLAESGTIIEYLCEHFGQDLIPRRYPEGKEGIVGAETEEWLRYKYLMHYAEGSFMTVWILALVVMKIRDAPVPFFIKPITRGVANNLNSSFVDRELKLNHDFLEDYLAKSPDQGEFFCGSKLTGADAMMIFVLEAGIAHGSLNEQSYPKMFNWVRKIQSREAYKRAGERVAKATGEPYVPFSEQPL